MTDRLESADGRFAFYIQSDGNAVLYQVNRDPWRALWSSGTAGDYANGPIVVEPAPPAPAPALPPRPSPGAGAALDRLVRVTDDQDPPILPRSYSYWPNAWIGPDAIYLFAGVPDLQPRFFQVTHGGTVTRLGPLVPYRSEAEGWYWDAAGWLYLFDGPDFRRVNPFTGEDRLVYTIRETHPGCILWQPHSADSGATHSATILRVVREGRYPRIGTLIVRRGEQRFVEAQGVLDESALTPDGQFCVIQENIDGDEGNRILDLDTGRERWLTDAAGAVGHSDCGPGIVVGEDNQHGACVLWDLRQPLTPDNRRELFSTWNMGHVSIRNGVCVSSTDADLAVVGLDGSGRRPFLAHGNQATGDYDDQVKANLDPSGRLVTFISNRAGRRDLYLAPVPR